MKRGLLLAVALIATSESAWGQARLTPWGHPNLGGYWDYRTITPLERPLELLDTPVLAEDEAQLFEQEFNDRRAIEGDYDEDRGFRLIAGRTSLIVNPVDGRIPFIDPAVRARRLGQRGRPRGTESYQQRGITERCISRSSFPRTPTLYNNFYQIFQTPDHVVIYSEMIHDARIIPLNRQPHIDPKIGLLYGDARGHWENTTLVVETTNFTGTLGTLRFGWSDNLHLVERLTPQEDGTISYEFTIDDPTVFTQPWTVQIPLKRFEGPLYEYACHEGNDGLPGILEVSRNLEKLAGESFTTR